MKKLALTALLLFVATPILAQSRPHLCQPGETPAFSCTSRGKIISLCASADLSETQGTLVYRFGTKQKIELSFPPDGTKPQSVFQYNITGATGGGAEFIRFQNGETIYTLYSDYYRGRESDGLVVERAGKRIATLVCKDSAVEPGVGWGRIYKAKLPEDKNGFDVPGIFGK